MKNAKAKIEYLQNKVIEIHNDLHRNSGKLEDFTNYLYDKVIDDVITDMDNKEDLIDHLEKFDGGNCLPYTWECIEVMKNHMEGVFDYLNENDYVSNTYVVGGKYDALDIPHMVWYALENYAHTMAVELDDIEEAYFYKELESDIQEDIINGELEVLDYDDIEREVATSMEGHINKLEDKFVKDVLLTCLDSDMIEREGLKITPYLKSEISLDDLSLEYINNVVKLEYGDGFEKLVDYMTGNTTLGVNIPTISIEWDYNRIIVDCDTKGWGESMEWYIISSVVDDIKDILEDFKDGDLMHEINRLFESWTSEDAIHESLYSDTWTLYSEDGQVIY